MVILIFPISWELLEYPGKSKNFESRGCYMGRYIKIEKRFRHTFMWRL
jgi:hypothetical protein